MSESIAFVSAAGIVRIVTLGGLVGVVSLANAGCTGGPRACSGVDPCSGDQVCQVGRCTSAGRLPTAPQSRRVVVELESMAYFDDLTDGTAPPELRFGAANSGTSLLMLRFPHSWTGAKVIEGAFVVLEPASSAAPNPKPVALDLWRLSDDAPLTRSRGGFPALSGPADGSALLAFTPPQPARIDVTSLVQDVEKEHTARLGLVLRSTTSEGQGNRYASGSLGRAPWLEVYVK